jgi:dihydrofolate reductase
MRKLKIMEHISLDGVIQHSADDGDFPYSDWTAPYRTPAGRDVILAAYGASFDLLLGRHTYDLWSGFWPKAPSGPTADGLNAATKYIATHRPKSLEWGPFEGLGADIVEGVRRIKSEDGPNLIPYPEVGQISHHKRVYREQCAKPEAREWRIASNGGAVFQRRISCPSFFSEDTAADEERKKVVYRFQSRFHFPTNNRSVPASNQ